MYLIMNLWKLVNSNWASQATAFVILTFITLLIRCLYKCFFIVREYNNRYDEDIYKQKKAELLLIIFTALILCGVLITTFYDTYSINSRIKYIGNNIEVNTSNTKANKRNSNLFLNNNNSLHIQNSFPNRFWDSFPPTVIFLMIVFFKLLLCFLCLVMIYSIIKTEKTSEIAAKFLGFEFQEKFFPNSENAIKEIETQIEFAANINTYAIQWITAYSEKDILNSSNFVEYIRNELVNVLSLVYYDSHVNYYVLPFTKKDLQVLNLHLVRMVNKVYKELGEVVTIPHKKVGLGIVNAGGEEEPDTIIIIDTSEAGYDITSVELQSIVMLFLSMTEIVLLTQDAYKN